MNPSMDVVSQRYILLASNHCYADSGVVCGTSPHESTKKTIDPWAGVDHVETLRPGNSMSERTSFLLTPCCDGLPARCIPVTPGAIHGGSVEKTFGGTRVHPECPPSLRHQKTAHGHVRPLSAANRP